MMDKPFRILLDLTDLHVEGFKYVWINVSPRELKTISDLKSDLLKKLNFERHDIKLFVRDGLLLDEETIIVLREDDTVKVQYEEQSVFSHTSGNCSLESKSQKTFQKRSCIECCEDSTPPPKSKKYKRSYASTLVENEDLELENKSKKKKKHKKSFGSPSDIPESVVTAVNISDKSPTDTENTTITLKDSKTYVENPDEICTNGVNVSMVESKKNEEFTTANETVLSEGKLETSSQKKKRKRHRKRKNTTNLVGSYAPSHDVTDSPSTNPTELQSVAPSTSFVRKHIFFTSPTPCQNSVNEVESKSKVNLESNKNVSSNVCSKSPSLNEDSSQNLLENTSSYPKISTPSVSNGYNNKNWTVSMLEDEILNSPSQNNIKNTKEKKSTVVKNLSCDLIIADKCDKVSETPSSQDKYKNLPLIKVMPAIGAHIAFKMLELDKNYSPTVSDFKEGIVKNIDPNTEDIEIELLEKEIKPGRVGKFENLKEDEMPDPVIIQTVTIQFSGLIDLRLVS
ncbi:coilin-like [Uloborus diversus]|uniref:coilin-like n=1 Tax=Uloborus diversus TaxID=327109 RepID=UPI002409440B|nr:coilin-like [Uloborus diversus]